MNGMLTPGELVERERFWKDLAGLLFSDDFLV